MALANAASSDGQDAGESSHAPYLGLGDYLALPAMVSTIEELTKHERHTTALRDLPIDGAQGPDDFVQSMFRGMYPVLCWSVSRTVYMMDEDLHKALMDSTHDDAPGCLHALLRLPDHGTCLSFRRSVASDTARCFVTVNPEDDANALVVVAYCDESTMPELLPSATFRVDESMTVEGFAHAFEESLLETMADQAWAPDFRHQIACTGRELMVGLMYIASQEPDLSVPLDKAKGTEPGPDGSRVYTLPTKSKVVRVGDRVGPAIRKGLQGIKNHQGGTVRPHMRSAHWHGYWKGPRNGDREFIHHWLPPTFVTSRLDDARDNA